MRRALTYLILAMIALLVALPGISTSAQGDPTVTPPPPQPIPNPILNPTAQAILERAEQANADAQEAINFANSIMAFIQAVTAVVGVLALLVGGASLFNAFNLERTRSKFEAEMRALQERGAGAITALTLLQIGKQQFEGHNLEEARETLLEAAKAQEDNPAVNYFLGEVYIQLGQLDEAIKYLRRAKADQDGRGVVAAKAAYAYALRQQGDRATDEAQKRALYAKAEENFRLALAYNPKLLDVEGEAHYGSLGGLYLRQKRYQDAIHCYLKAAEATGSKKSYPYNNLGIIYTRLHDTANARASFKKSAEIAALQVQDRPRDYWARADLVTALIMLGEEAEARIHLEQLFRHMPGPRELEKFQDGLKQLNEAAPKPLLDETIERVQSEIDRHKAANPPA